MQAKFASWAFFRLWRNSKIVCDDSLKRFFKAHIELMLCKLQQHFQLRISWDYFFFIVIVLAEWKLTDRSNFESLLLHPFLFQQFDLIYSSLSPSSTCLKTAQLSTSRGETMSLQSQSGNCEASSTNPLAHKQIWKRSISDACSL